MSQNERRKWERKKILEAFSLFIVIPKKGDYRLPVHDLSAIGVGFDLDMDGEDPGLVPVQKGEVIDFKLYLNQTLFLPLKLKVTRITEKNGIRNAGGEFIQDQSNGLIAYQAFFKVIEAVEKI